MAPRWKVGVITSGSATVVAATAITAVLWGSDTGWGHRDPRPRASQDFVGGTGLAGAPGQTREAGGDGGATSAGPANTPTAGPGSATEPGGAPGGTGAPPGGTPRSESPSPVPHPATVTAVTYTVSGDFAGRTLRVLIDPMGHWTRSETGQAGTFGALTDTQVRSLAALLNDPALADEAAKGGRGLGTPCPDFPTRVLATDAFTVRSRCDSPSLPAFDAAAEAIRNYTGG